MEKNISTKVCGFLRRHKLLIFRIMKRSQFILLILFSISTFGFSQKVTIKMGKVTLSNALKKISNQTNLDFFYNAEMFDMKRVVDVDFEDVDVITVVRRIVGNKYVVEFQGDDVLLIIPKEEAGQQKIVVRGEVVDENGVGLPGVTVVEEQARTGATTDFDGNYQIRVSPDAVLTFSYMGYITQKIPVAGKSDISVQMKPDISELSEVVVTGYQNIQKKLFTGASSTVKPVDIQQAGVPEVSRMLEGKVAGVSVQNVSGTFGTGPKITIRGASSIYGETRPLWVVDGVVLENVVNITADQLSSGNANTVIASSIAGLNAEDIASIEVLKDASATSLYGARAMNGVVVVTTKSGKRGKLSVNYSGQFALNLKPTYNSYNIMNSQDQVAVFREMDTKGNLNITDVANRRNGGIYNLYYNALGTLNSDGSFVYENTPEGKAKFLQKYELINTDWFDELFNLSQTQTHSLSLSSGNEKSQVYASTSYYHDPGWSKANNTRRVTANINTNFKLSDKVQFGALSNLSLRKQKLPGTFSRTTDVVNGQFERDFDINPFSYALNTSRASRPYNDHGEYENYRMNWTDFNILRELDNNYIDMDVLDAKLQLKFNYKIMDGLEWTSIGNMRYVKTSQKHIITEDSNAANAYRAADNATVREANVFLFDDPDYPNQMPKVVLPYGGFYNRNDIDLESYYFRNTLNYEKTFDNIHDLNVFGGQELRFINRDFSGFEGVGIQYNKGNSVYVDPDFYKFRSLTSSKPFSVSEERERFLSYFARVNYAYHSKYIVTLTGRYDGSNKLGNSRDARWLPTWNVGGAWDLKQENFLSEADFLSRLKLRATYGLTANLGVAENALAIYMSSTTTRRDANRVENQIYIDALENSELTWEKQHELNLGLDLGFLDNKITLNTDVYFRKGFDLIDYVQTSGIGGQFTKAANFADMSTKGVELTLNSQNIYTQDFKWTTNFTLGYYDQEITRLENSPRVVDLVLSGGGAYIGGPQRGLYSIPFAGLSEEGIPTFYDEKGEVTSSVNFQSTDVDFLKYEGRVDPNLTMGLTNRFRYKNFELDFFLSYQGGNVIRLDPAFSASYSDLSVFTEEFKNRWLIPGDENKTNVPVILSQRQLNEDSGLGVTYNNYNYSTERVAKGDFLRLKTVGFTYYFEDNLLSNLGLSNLSMQLQSVNPWLIFSDKKLHGQDPEFFRAGGVAYPITKIITYTLRVGF
ncbi:TonB-linked outer membrane protein, SusC/RagA family [Sinomicrobium oceani]|uniref:TonB-linked outer membrane protein, SusC/RagA family n=2 Tax=Sinomicrobium oceani TaxID=1150368 RepID=A0A1K1PVT5_9FLAO|nr:TonB-linked outer membrane protein, SusC/RagA family [Sinomicrobium oceani]